MRNIEFRIVRPCTSPAHTHSVCTCESVAVASWKSTPSNVTLTELGPEPILTVASLLRGPMLPPCTFRSRTLLIHIPPVITLASVTPVACVEPASTFTYDGLTPLTVTWLPRMLRSPSVTVAPVAGRNWTAGAARPATAGIDWPP